jgi:hypothetical protein
MANDGDDRGVTVLVSTFAAVGVVRERKTRRRGYAVLGEAVDGVDDNESCTQEDFEKMWGVGLLDTEGRVFGCTYLRLLGALLFNMIQGYIM